MNDPVEKFLKILEGILFILAIFCVFAIITAIREGGWYCEYCKLAEESKGVHASSSPCKKSISGKHHIVWYFSKPEGGYNWRDHYNRNLE